MSGPIVESPSPFGHDPLFEFFPHLEIVSEESFPLVIGTIFLATRNNEMLEELGSWNLGSYFCSLMSISLMTFFNSMRRALPFLACKV